MGDQEGCVLVAEVIDLVMGPGRGRVKWCNYISMHAALLVEQSISDTKAIVLIPWEHTHQHTPKHTPTHSKNTHQHTPKHTPTHTHMHSLTDRQHLEKHTVTLVLT